MWSFKVDRIGFGERNYLGQKAIIAQSQMFISLEDKTFNKTMEQLISANSSIECHNKSGEYVCGSAKYSCSDLNDTLPKF